jgi:hypothetical protein
MFELLQTLFYCRYGDLIGESWDVGRALGGSGWNAGRILGWKVMMYAWRRRSSKKVVIYRFVVMFLPAVDSMEYETFLAFSECTTMSWILLLNKMSSSAFHQITVKLSLTGEGEACFGLGCLLDSVLSLCPWYWARRVSSSSDVPPQLVFESAIGSQHIHTLYFLKLLEIRWEEICCRERYLPSFTIVW